MRIRVSATVFSSFVMVVTPACLELSTTNPPGTTSGGGGSNGSSGATGGMGTGGDDVVGGTSSTSSASSSSSSSSSSSASSSSSGGMAKCDEPNPTCSTCEVCEGQTMGGACTNEYAACQANQNCAAVDACVHACPSGNKSCMNDCYSMLGPGGVQSLYFEYHFCMYCGVCSGSCAMAIPCAD